jgi:hypothetical protein
MSEDAKECWRRRIEANKYTIKKNLRGEGGDRLGLCLHLGRERVCCLVGRRFSVGGRESESRSVSATPLCLGKMQVKVRTARSAGRQPAQLTRQRSLEGERRTATGEYERCDNRSEE